jgi:hypothetical protein
VVSENCWFTHFVGFSSCSRQEAKSGPSSSILAESQISENPEVF